MVDPFAANPESTDSPGAERARADLHARYAHLGAGEAAQASSDWTASAGFRAQASRTASEARGAAASIAEQARLRLTEIVDEQKSAGATRIAGVAHAAHTAADDLDGSNPELARLVRAAAEGVDRIAADVRGGSLGDIVDTVASFGRRQPVAFFGGAVLTGFLLSRFFKSDAPVIGADPADSA